MTATVASRFYFIVCAQSILKTIKHNVDIRIRLYSFLEYEMLIRLVNCVFIIEIVLIRKTEHTRRGLKYLYNERGKCIIIIIFPRIILKYYGSREERLTWFVLFVISNTFLFHTTFLHTCDTP